MILIVSTVVLVLLLVVYNGGAKLESSQSRNPESGNISLVDVYQANVRAPIFAALITVGSFLLTLKTAILQRLKDGFDTERYADRYRAHKEENPNLDVKYYGSLRRLSTALAAAIFLCFLSSIMQMSLGFIPHATATLACLVAATLAIFLVLFLTREMFIAHNEWFDKIEEDRLRDLAPKKH
jgi:hypothetical protein